MATIYIVSKIGKISKEAETLIFTQQDGTSTVLFPFKTEILFVVGKISVSGDALRMFAKYKIPVIFLSSNGQFNAKLVYGDSKNVFLRQKQYEILSSQEKTLQLAKSIVFGKIRNQLSFMQRIKRKGKPLSETEETIIEKNIQALKNILNDVVQCSALDALRGYEGLAAKKYFETYGLNFNDPWASFPKRSRNPPETNVNAVLSFLYTLLMYRVEAAVESTGMDIMVGSLHACDYGRNSLVFDLMEEFRTPIADTVCCSLFNLNILTKEDFQKVNFDSDNQDFPLPVQANKPGEILEKINSQEGILLTEKGLKKVIKAFEDKITTSVQYENSKLSYQKIIIKQVLAYKRVIAGEENEYKSFYFK